MNQIETCPGCGLRLKRVEGPTDPYSGASASCWAAFGEVLSREFQELSYPEFHRSESPRVSRRLFDVSQATMAGLGC